MSGDKAAEPPSRRSRLLLIICSSILAMWVAAMIAMYVVTVYPQRHPATPSVIPATN